MPLVGGGDALALEIVDGGVIQECISLVVFAVIANLIFQHEHLHWNHAAAALCLVSAVYFVFMKP